MGHEYVGIVEEVGSAVRTIRPGQFVTGSFFASEMVVVVAMRPPRDGVVPSLRSLTGYDRFDAGLKISPRGVPQTPGHQATGGGRYRE
jgi:hypothetical protein